MNIKSRTFSAGLSLVELMVAMVIGLFLVGGLATLVFNSKKAYETQDYAARLQENARFATQFLGYDLRMAGYSGCAGVAGSLEGQDPSSDGYGDVVQFFYADPAQTIALTSDADLGDTTVVVSSVAGLAQDQSIIVADCGATDLVQITNINESTLTLTVAPALSRLYEEGVAEIQRYGAYTYEIKKIGDVPSLVRTVDGVDEEMVEGVEYMRLLYGEDTTGNGTPDEYLPEDEVDNWALVKSMKIGLLLRSVSNYSSDAVSNPDREYGSDTSSGPYDILDLTGDDAVDPPQGSLQGQRRVFVNTVFVRNQT